MFVYILCQNMLRNILIISSFILSTLKKVAKNITQTLKKIAKNKRCTLIKIAKNTLLNNKLLINERQTRIFVIEIVRGI